MTMPDVPPPAARQNFGLLELATSFAALVIVLGLAVSLARYVRSKDSMTAIRAQFIDLNRRLAERGWLGDAETFAPTLAEADETADPAAITAAAQVNAAEWTTGLGVVAAAAIDPWGAPVVLIDGNHPGLGLSPRLRPFFMSPGPDGRYFTLADNIYSYDISFLAPNAPATRPAGGHGE